MKRLSIFLISVTLHAATYYVSNAGSDSSDGSQDLPWLTLQHAVNSIACGDTINVVANGSYVLGDASLPGSPNGAPALASCGQTTTVQSSEWAQFAPTGYRTNPTNDAALYGKLKFSGQGIIASAEVHGWSNALEVYCPLTFGTLPSATITVNCSFGLPNLANGSIVEFEIPSAGTDLPTILAPAPLSLQQHYYVVNCSVSCGANGSTFQVSATSGGSAIPITTCNTACAANTQAVEPMQVNTSTSVLTTPDAMSVITNGTPVAFSAGGVQLNGVLPAPLALDTVYYAINVSGRTLQISATPGGSAISLTTTGFGMISMANVNVPSHWLFRGLELVNVTGQQIFALLQFGSGLETSLQGMISNMEVSHCYFHDAVGGPYPIRAIVANGPRINIHDSYISGMASGGTDAQAILAFLTPGPLAVTNNFLSASGEVILIGGSPTAYPVTNQNMVTAGNYFYKPPAWKTTSSTATPSGPCWYDTTDAAHAGGEWYQITGGQVYQCGSDFAWHTSGASMPAALSIKNMYESKTIQNAQVLGNRLKYSWANGQSGQAFVLRQGTSINPVNNNITVMNNSAVNVFNAVVADSSCTNAVMVPCPTIPANHTFLNNLMVVSVEGCGVAFANTLTCGFNPYPNTWAGYPESGEVWNHNTVVSPDSGLAFSPVAVFDSPSAATCAGPTFGTLSHWFYANSLVNYDWGGNCAGAGAALALWHSFTTLTNIAMVGATGSYGSPGATNVATHLAFPANNAAVHYVGLPADYVNVANGDYHLTSSSPFSAANGSATLLSTDGTDLGADIDLVNMATSGAAAGTPPWDRQAGLRVNPGSSQVVFRYTAPTSDACTATIYQAPARIPANQVVSVADNSANSISDALTRELYVSGLQPATPYWYKLACGGGVLLVGNLLTRATGQGSFSFTFDWSTPTAMQYSSSRSMSSPVSLPAATRQSIPVAANSVVYVQIGAAGPITMLIAP